MKIAIVPARLLSSKSLKAEVYIPGAAIQRKLRTIEVRLRAIEDRVRGIRSLVKEINEIQEEEYRKAPRA